jgi:hypothetical protein
MFATLLGALPDPTDGAVEGAGGGDVEAQVAIAVRAQEAAGIEPITDGRLRARAGLRGMVVADWEATQRLTDRAVKQALPGPFAVARTAACVESAASPASAPGAANAAGATESWATPFASVEALAAKVNALAAAGCPLVELEETDLPALADPSMLAEFVDAHRRFLDALDGHGSAIHRSLSLVGSAPPKEAAPAILELPYASLAVDLIHGPDSWNLVTRLPGDRGVIAGALSADGAGIADEAGEPTEVLLWAAGYAASTRGRGPARVGLGSAGSWANLTWAAAVARMDRLGDAARLAAGPMTEEQVRELDPRAVSIRRAALGHDAPPPPRRRAR